MSFGLLGRLTISESEYNKCLPFLRVIFNSISSKLFHWHFIFIDDLIDMGYFDIVYLMYGFNYIFRGIL